MIYKTLLHGDLTEEQLLAVYNADSNYLCAVRKMRLAEYEGFKVGDEVTISGDDIRWPGDGTGADFRDFYGGGGKRIIELPYTGVIRCIQFWVDTINHTTDSPGPFQAVKITNITFGCGDYGFHLKHLIEEKRIVKTIKN